jgi:phage-related protein
MAEGLLAGVAFVDILPRFEKFAASAAKDVESAAKDVEGSFSSKFANFGKTALIGVAGAAAGIGAEAVHLADNFELAHARLETAVKNLGGTFEQIKTPLGDAEGKLEKFGFTNAEVENAVARLAPATKDAGAAIADMSLAADIARGRHISLEDATQILVKVQTGHVALLGRLGIATKDATGHTISNEEAMKRLAAMYGGNASASAQTFAGKMQAVKAQAEDLGVKLGQALIPIIQKVISVITNVVTWLEKHRGVAVALGIAIGSVLVVAIVAYTISMAAAAIATIAATWPILAIIAAVALVAVGIYELATHWKEIWEEIKALVAVAVDWIKDHFYVLVAIVGLPVVALYELYTHWSDIWGFIQSVIDTAWNWINDHIGLIVGVVGGPILAAINFLRDNWDAVWNGIRAVVETVWGVLKPIFDTIKRAIDDIVGGIGKVASAASSIGGAIGDVGGLLGFDEGGWVPGPPGAPRLAVVHGGEFVLSNDALRGATSAPPVLPAQSGSGHGHDIYLDRERVGTTMAPTNSRAMNSRSMAYSGV